MRIRFSLQLVAVAIALVVPSTVFAVDGGITGTVTESSTGKAVTGAEVRVIAEGGTSKGGHKLAEIVSVQDSDMSGKFSAGSLTAGQYTVVVTHPEYKSQVQKQVQVSAASPTTLDVKLASKNQY